MQVHASLVCPFVSCVLRTFQCTETDTTYTLDLVYNTHTGVDQKKISALVTQNTGVIKGKRLNDANVIFTELNLSGIIGLYVSRGMRAVLYNLFPGLQNPLFEVHLTVTLRGECHLNLLYRVLGPDKLVTNSALIAHHVLRLPVGSSTNESMFVFYDMQHNNVERKYMYKDYMSDFRMNLNLLIVKQTQKNLIAPTQLPRSIPSTVKDHKLVVPVRTVVAPVAGDVRSIDEKTFLLMMHMYHTKGDLASIQEAVLTRGLTPEGISRWLQILSSTQNEQKMQFAKLLNGNVSLLEYTQLLSK